MDEWVTTKARQAHAASTARVHVCIDDDGDVCALFATSFDSVAAAEVSNTAARGRSVLPSLLLARFAVRSDLRGSGLGIALFHEVIRVCMAIDAGAPISLLIVDAKNERLASWYEGLGFARFKNASLRLYMSAKKVKASYAAAELELELEAEMDSAVGFSE